MTNELAIRILTGDVLGTKEQAHEAVKMAIKALSNTNGETIYRQAVFDVLREECSTAVEDFLRDKVKAIPSAQPEQRWIPCSKNMPKEGQLIYASFPYLHCCKVMEYSPYIRDAIDAWIPLPEPYAERRQDE